IVQSVDGAYEEDEENDYSARTTWGVFDIFHQDNARLLHPIQFEITDDTRGALAAWIEHEELKPDHYLFPSRLRESPHISIRQYARMVASWVSLIGLDARAYGTQSLRRTKPALMYRRTGNLEAMQELLGHTRRTTTARFLGIRDEG